MTRLEKFALLWLALFVVWGCGATDKPSDEGAASGEAGMEAGEEAVIPEGTVESLEAESGRRESEKHFLVEQFMKFGNEARERGNWEEAQANYAKVLQMNPENAVARKRFDEASGILGIAPSEARAAMDGAVSEREVRRQQAQAEISDLVRTAEMMESQGNFPEAIRKYEKALLIVGLYPYYGDFTPGESALKDMIARSTARKVKAEKERRDAENREAQKIKEVEERRVRQARKARITALFRDANLAMQRNQFDVAREYSEQILRLDPGNQTAAKLKGIAREASIATDEAQTRLNNKEQWKRTFEEVRRAAIPQVQEVVFPEEWLRVQTNRKAYGIGTGAAVKTDPRTREIENILATTIVNINFEETPLQDAVNFLAQYAGVNILVLPAVGEEKSEDDLLVSLQADDITVKAALDLIAVTKGLAHRIEKGVVQITTETEGAGPLVLDIYDVKDLTVPIQSFPGEDINLVPSGGFGFGFDEGEKPEPIQTFEGDALADLIRDTINLGDEGDVQFKDGSRILIVKAPAEAHHKIQDLLHGLRGTGGLTVSLETRFITVEDSFLQDIGVDLRDLGDDSGGIGAEGKGRTIRFDDVLSGTPGAPAGIGTSNRAGVFYNMNSDGDLRGRVENLLDVALGREGFMTNSGGTSIQATWLDDVQAEVVLRAVEKSTRSTVVTAPKLTAFNGERANITVLNQVSYIQDFDVEIAQRAQIGDPIVQTLRDGVILDITPIVSADRRYVTLELRPTVAILQRPIKTLQTTLANGPPVVIQLPELEISRVRTTVTMPDGGILLLGGLKFMHEQRMESTVPWLGKIPILSFFWSRKSTYVDKKNLIILVKAKIIVLEEMEPTFGED